MQGCLWAQRFAATAAPKSRSYLSTNHRATTWLTLHTGQIFTPQRKSGPAPIRPKG